MAKSNNDTYGCLDWQGTYYDVSRCLTAAKKHATKNGISEVYRRINNGYTVIIEATKIDGKWTRHN